jgi:hypothetical protein
MNQGNIRPDSRIGQIGRPVTVYAEGGFRLVLRLVHGGVCGRIEDKGLGNKKSDQI